MQSRSRILKRIGFLYKNKFKWINTCVYCGDCANTKDHVLPVSVANFMDFNDEGTYRRFKNLLVKVPACSECNALAGDEVHDSIRERRKYIQSRLRARYKKRLSHVIWDQEEMEELGYNLRTDVEKAMHNRSYLESRVYYPIKIKAN